MSLIYHISLNLIRMHFRYVFSQIIIFYNKFLVISEKIPISDDFLGSFKKLNFNKYSVLSDRGRLFFKSCWSTPLYPYHWSNEGQTRTRNGRSRDPLSYMTYLWYMLRSLTLALVYTDCTVIRTLYPYPNDLWSSGSVRIRVQSVYLDAIWSGG